MKKELPLVFLKNFKTKKNEYVEILLPVEKEKFIVRYRDIEKPESLYFFISQYEPTKDKYHITIKPTSENDVKPRVVWVSMKELNHEYIQWSKIVKDYNECISIFDDPILNSFKDNYYTEFEIIEDDKEKPLNPNQILLLDEYFDKVDKKINKYINNSNEKEITEIKSDIVELRDNLSSKPKIWIANKVSWIWAKITKLGSKFIKEFLNEGNKQIVKQGVSELVEFGKNLLT